MWALMENPQQYKELSQQSRRIARSAIEEILRWATPVYHFRRTATVDTEFRGKEIKQGDKVVIWHTSADRDEQVFDDPFTFDITAGPTTHRLRRRWRPLLPRRQLGSHGAATDLPGDPRTHPRHDDDRGAVDAAVQLHRWRQAPAGQVHRGKKKNPAPIS
jgi:hypothetical protein